MIVAIGRMDVYERDGVYQLYVDMLMPVGAGDLMQGYEALKKKLAAEGLFAQDKKKPLPAHPETVGIITSSAGAAVRDINIVSGKGPG
jgi:exodeoxyribonuclease VII large subunit